MENHKPHVLIVDDERGLRLGTKRLLESEGFYAEAAENGTEGIRLAKMNEFDLAIIDLRMPDIDGIQVLKEIRKANPNTVCFIATAYASYDTAIESTKLGAYSYIPKPFTPDELLLQLRKGYEKRLLILEAERLRKEREERLLEIAYEKTRLKTIIDSITEGALVVNKTGELVLYNSSALKYLDLHEIFIGDVILEILPDEITQIIKKFIDSETYIPNSYSTQIELKPNKELVIEATCSPVPHADGSLAGVVTVIRNITESVKVEAIKSQFVSMVAHELKTPIAAVIGFLKIILDNEVNVSPEQQKDFLQRSYTRLQNLVVMVNDLLDISRMELKKTQREIKELEISQTVRSIIEFLELELHKKKITVNFHIDSPGTKLKADQNEINRLFTNILSNAVKYNKDNGSIDISISSSGNYIITRISDTGIGMTKEEKSRLFQEFYRVKNDKTRGISGTGLGLSIVKRIVDSYAGKIEVESKSGEGTTFSVYLPLSINKQGGIAS
ncbi:MAG TPA: ATP-binding protein [Ignavibacteriales bacterium]|nr:ATP-binding protein [Ignavibacteriales bacterium]